MPIVNDLLTGNRRVDPRVFLHILRFRDLLTRATSSQVLIRNSYPACLACQNLRCAGHAKFSGMPGVSKSAERRSCQYQIAVLIF